MRRVGWVEQVGIQHRIVLYSSQRDTLLAEMVKCGLEIVNRFWHSGIFEYAFHSISERPVFQRDHRPSARRIRNSNTLHNSGTFILTLILPIRGLQSQKPRLRGLRLVFFPCALDINALPFLFPISQPVRPVSAHSLQIPLEFTHPLHLPSLPL